jgi:hypothetical protein
VNCKSSAARKQEDANYDLVLCDRAVTNPEWWVREVLGDDPWQKQVEIIESVRDNPETAVRSCHGAGKSFIASRCALWFLYNHPDSVVITTAPGRRQVRGILWKEIRSAHRKAKVPLGGRVLTQELELSEEWFAWGFTAPEYDPDRFQGFHAEHILVIVDEASGVSPVIFDEGVSSVLSSSGSRLLMIGNPTNPNGEFAKAFKDPNVKKIAISAFDTPNFTAFGITQKDIENDTWRAKITGPLPNPRLVEPAWVAKRWARWGRSVTSPNYAARVLGLFPDISPDTLLPLHWIEAAQQRDLAPRDGDPNNLGVDVARFGADETVIMHRHGPRFRVVFGAHGLSTAATTGHVCAWRMKTGATTSHVDDAGIGGAVTDQLNAVNEPVTPINVGETKTVTEPDRFINLKAELYWRLREMFERGEIDIDPADEELASQLSTIKYFYDNKGRIGIERKEDAKKRGLPSPDRADALMLAAATDLTAAEREENEQRMRAMGAW